jgi:hypothetical protein
VPIAASTTLLDGHGSTVTAQIDSRLGAVSMREVSSLRSSSKTTASRAGEEVRLRNIDASTQT